MHQAPTPVATAHLPGLVAAALCGLLCLSCVGVYLGVQATPVAPAWTTRILVMSLLGVLLCLTLAAVLYSWRQRWRQLDQQLASTRAELIDEMHGWGEMMATLGGSIVDWDLAAGRSHYSAQWLAMLGLSAEEVGERPEAWRDYVHPDDMPGLEDSMQAVFEERWSGDGYVFRLHHKNGHWLWIRGHAIVVKRNSQGQPQRVIGINIDITSRKMAESIHDALINAHEDASIGMFASRQGRIVFANNTFAALCGRSLDELLVLPDASQLVHADDRERVQQAHTQAYVEGRRNNRLFLRLMTPDGRCRDIENAVSYVHDSEVFDTLGIVIDITEQKHLAENLQKSHDMLDRFSSQLPGVLFQFQLSADGQVSFPFISDNIHERYGVSAEQYKIESVAMSRYQHPDDRERIAASFVASATDLTPLVCEYRILLPQGEVRWIHTAANPQRLEDGGTLWHGYSYDITERKHMEDALRASDERFRSLTQMGADGYWELDSEFRFTELVGGTNFQAHLKNYMHQAIGKTRWQLAGDVMPEVAWQEHKRQLAQHLPFRDFEFQLLGDDGEVRMLSISGAPLFDERGVFHGYRGVGSDITERQHSEEGLRLAAMVYDNSSEAMSITAVDGRVLTVNPAFTRITGYEADEIIGQHARFFGLDQASFDLIKEAIDSQGYWHGETWNRRKDGDVYPALITINTIFDATGQPYRYVSLFSDITNRKQTEILIWRQANFDALTQLPNRSMFYERVGQELKKAQRSGHQLALLFIDLDHFKEVNDTLGHDTGDHLLLEAARRLVSCVRETDTVARLGGDEFTVMLCDIASSDVGVIDRIAGNIIDCLSQPFQLGANEVYVSASIGITLYPQDADNIESLFKHADQAMYLSKSRGRNQYSYFTPELQAQAQQRLRLVTDLRVALAARQFQVWFQPIVDLATRRIVKAEALLRWQHPENGMVPPDIFVPLAEETGLISEIGDWVFEEAMRWTRRWQEAGWPELQMSVNKSPVQFHKLSDDHQDWLNTLAALQLQGASLNIEITEGVLLNANEDVVAALGRFRAAGVQVSLDDFGTGYSSLAYLNRFDIDYLKIDRSFVSHLSRDSKEMALSEAIIVMAHKLGLKVVAEGVESPAQHDLLSEIGCDYGQGYLYSAPRPAGEFEALLIAQGPTAK